MLLLGIEVIYPVTDSSIELRALTLDVFQRRLLFSVPVNFSIESVNVHGKEHQTDHHLPHDFYSSYIYLDTFNG